MVVLNPRNSTRCPPCLNPTSNNTGLGKRDEVDNFHAQQTCLRFSTHWFKACMGRACLVAVSALLGSRARMLNRMQPVDLATLRMSVCFMCFSTQGELDRWSVCHEGDLSHGSCNVPSKPWRGHLTRHQGDTQQQVLAIDLGFAQIVSFLFSHGLMWA
jgi:hypothetical protein